MLSILNQIPPKKAVAYYRHSAEDKQENSVPIQREHAQKFAALYNIEIVHEEADEGVSGLIANRPGFKRLFKDWVYNEDAPHIDYVLFYDISRWGRFQDQNEGAYYAFICTQHGKILLNVSRGFPREEHKLTSSLMDSIDRFMAAEYSRVLSDKVWHGCMKVSRDGFSVGGTAPYGMARLLLDESKKPICILKKGQHKMIDNQRVIFTPLNDETTQTIKEMFRLLVDHWYTPSEIAKTINGKGIPAANGGVWNREKVIRILTNEAYAGTRVYNKTWHRLQQSSRRNPKSEWVRTPNAFTAIVDMQTFNKAQEFLYWQTPARWKKGVYLTNKAKEVALKEIKHLAKNQSITDEEVKSILQKFPIIFSVTSNTGSISQWCFVIPEKFRQYEWVLGTTVNLEQLNSLDEIFILPIQDFNSSNFLIVNKDDDKYTNYLIDKSRIENKVLSVIKYIVDLAQKEILIP